MAKTAYDIIKKQNGEKFARVLRDKNLLDIPDIVNIVKYAGHDAADAEQLFPYLWSLKDFKEIKDAPIGDPFQLLDQAGYYAFEVHNQKEQNSIKRFFRENEELCTFHDPRRYRDNYIIHAIKHDVWCYPYAIQPFPTPKRQDAYGTSVISIQIKKSGGFISIKNRYNHTVLLPDQTFNSNPDEIIPGLSAALKAYFNVDWLSTGVNVPSGFILLNNQILKVNFEIMNQCIGDGFYTTPRGKVIDIDKRNQIQMDYFIWDRHEKCLLSPSQIYDSFIPLFNEFIHDKKLTITGKSPNQTILADDVPFIELQNNQIVSLNMSHIKMIGNEFLLHNTALTHLDLSSLEQVGSYFLCDNTALTHLDLPKLKTVDRGFLHKNTALTHLDLPKLEKADDDFLKYNTALTHLDLPSLKQVGSNFLCNNTALTYLDLPKLEKADDDFLKYNTALTHLDLPNLKQVGSNFLCNNTALTYLDLPKLERVGSNFLKHNTALTHLDSPKLERVGNCFLFYNIALTHLDLPKLERVGNCFLTKNNTLTHLNLPKLEQSGLYFLNENTTLTHLTLPSLEFLQHNERLLTRFAYNFYEKQR